ncbi:MAG: bifunctional YncE family protein/alkaline phosphatase family protein [Armatimonadetes bacterium]|nr:bifunctional YncE family protein/alkaline phosphatase family protein [Armatimonadota bacterium]
MMRRAFFFMAMAIGIGGVAIATLAALANGRMLGEQPDGRFLVATGQLVAAGDLRFVGRPADMARRPQGNVYAVSLRDQPSNARQILLFNRQGIVAGSAVPLRHAPGYHGIEWSPDGTRLYLSCGEQTDDAQQGRHDGVIETFAYSNGKLTPMEPIIVGLPGEPGNPVPGGLCLNGDGSRLYVAATDLNAVVEIDTATGRRNRKFPTGMLPYGIRLSADEKMLVVTNWGGRIPKPTDRKSKTGVSEIAVDNRGTASTGSATLIDLQTGSTSEVEVGLHPTDVAVSSTRAYVANSMSDSVSEIDLRTKGVRRTIPLHWNGTKLVGSMPVALAQSGSTLYVCNGGDNAVAEIDLASGQILGYRPSGFFPIAICLDGKNAVVLNSKGNGSVAKTGHGLGFGNAHDFEGTVSWINLGADRAKETALDAQGNRWEQKPSWPSLAVYNGAIKHVIYIIKENRTYDEVFGDMPEGNGDPKLAILGRDIAPNHQAIAREFTLFDNGYVSGTNSCDGHAWSTQALANEYIERFYVGYSRTYNDDGNCAMSLSSTGAIWDAALAKGKSVRNYGEFCYAGMAKFSPRPPKDWFEAWEDREQGTRKFTFEPVTLVPSLKPVTNPRVHYWPLIQSDQARADEFIREWTEFGKAGKTPDLSILTLPNDHTEGLDPAYPSPRAMVADNDLALGRVVEAVSRSPQLKNTCIFVIEDDAQNGPDHVDGHRSVFMVVSPYNRRRTVDSTFYTTVSMVKSIEAILGIPPMNRFDYMADPITGCFTDKPDFTPFTARPNRVRLDEPNPGRDPSRMSQLDRYWTNQTLNLDWSEPDAPDNDTLNRAIWYSVRGTQPYPGQPGGEDE